MIYALNAEELSYGDEADGVLEYADEAAAESAFREYVAEYKSRPYTTTIQCHLFRTREQAVTATLSTDDEVLINDGHAFRTLEWERGYGFNF